MGTINIYPPVEVFDDLDNCEDRESLCKYIKNRYGYCETFRDVLRVSTFAKKCAQCKEYYQKEKERLDKKIVAQQFNKGTGAMHLVQTTVGEEEEYLKKGLASADKFIDKMEKVAPLVLGDENQ